MDQQGYLTDQVHTRIGAAAAGSAGTAVVSKIYDLGKIGARGVCVRTAIATINAGNYLVAYGTDTPPSDGTEANGEYTGSTALSATIAGSKTQGGTNADKLRLDIKNCKFRYVQFAIIRAGANTATEQMDVDFYNFNKTPQVSLSTTTTVKLNAPLAGTP